MEKVAGVRGKEIIHALDQLAFRGKKCVRGHVCMCIHKSEHV